MSASVLITGANSGLGFAAARTIAAGKGGHTVLVACRTVDKAIDACTRLGGGDQDRIRPVHHPLDLSDLHSVASFAEYVKETHPVDVLVQNAALFVDGSTDISTVNAIAPALLANKIQPSAGSVAVITDPAVQTQFPVPTPQDLRGDEAVKATSVPDLVVRYIASKTLLAALSVHHSRLTNTPLVLLAPGTIDTGIHAKATPHLSWWMQPLYKLSLLFKSNFGELERTSATYRNAVDHLLNASPDDRTMFNCYSATPEVVEPGAIPDAWLDPDVVKDLYDAAQAEWPAEE